ncbi:MAG: nucleotidyltransferase domain-containing protein [Desulfosarcina sp.]|nr:nucleotidyltransferase domain-containing protein [Desulfosarcina sp.]
MNRHQIITILKGQKDLLRRFSVKKVYLFGSSARNEATDTSDVELIVEFSQNARVSLFQFARLRRELSQVLDCDVDIPWQDMRNLLSHEYLGVTAKIVWETIQTDLPAIVPRLKALLQ